MSHNIHGKGVPLIIKAALVCDTELTALCSLPLALVVRHCMICHTWGRGLFNATEDIGYYDYRPVTLLFACFISFQRYALR